MNNLQEEILRLKKETGTVILAHNYVAAEIQDVADFCGDSLELSIKAKQSNAKRMVCCGVRFMAETAKILSPDSVVLLPNSDAGCPMADMVNPAQIAEYRKAHPDTFLVAYVNTTAETKAEVNCCCTSGNADRVIGDLASQPDITFLPDRNLGANVSGQLARAMNLWNGCCPVHDAVTPEMIKQARTAHPAAEILVHPECRPEVVKLADHALSTGAILKHATASPCTEFVIGTECGILHRLRKENPGKVFYELEPRILCRDMKKITLENLRDALSGKAEEIILSRELMDKARSPIEKMLAIR